MAKTTAWHSRLILDRNVYHDETRCTEGNNIEPRNRAAGTGNRPKCHHCRAISGLGGNQGAGSLPRPPLRLYFAKPS
jgi:hypothetical protein